MLEDGRKVTMSELQIGDQVQTGLLKHFFLHIIKY